MSSPLTHFINTTLPPLTAEMRRVLHADAAPENDFYGLIHYHMGWVDASFKPQNSKTGKHIRPLICMLCAEAAGGRWQDVLPAAAAIEILHNFTLIHDDIEDGSPTRRGRPTLWSLWGAPLAINSGDAMFAAAQLSMTNLQKSGVSAAVIVQAIIRLNQTCLALTAGQHADMIFETRDNVSVDDYLAMIRGKTAVLLALSTELGALIAGADAERVAHFSAFGLELGLAFQVIDDILGIWGDEKQIGKSAASDIATKKKTLPVLYGLGVSAELKQLYTTSPSTTFVPLATRLLTDCGARTYAENQAAKLTQSALNHLAAAAAPQGKTAAAPHGEIVAAPHGEIVAAPHGKTAAAPHGEIIAALYQLVDKLLNRQV